jgi:hypothetical protein
VEEREAAALTVAKIVSIMLLGSVRPHSISVSLYFTFSLVFFPEDGGSRFFGNVNNDQPDYTTSNPMSQ